MEIDWITVWMVASGVVATWALAMTMSTLYFVLNRAPENNTARREVDDALKEIQGLISKLKNGNGISS